MSKEDQLPSKSRTEEERRKFGPYERGLSRVQLEQLFNHHRWLASQGRFGERLVLVGSSQGKLYRNVNLHGVDFSRALLVNVSFISAGLREAHFSGAELRGVIFFSCDVAGADFTDSKLEQVSFKKSNHRQAHFNNVDIEKVYWNGERPVYKQRHVINSAKL
jgi:uncharacterized protein YjbI with pentapeptide repeats